MQYHFPISPAAYQIVAMLQEAGFESYIVGGAIRDLLLQRKPKDFDISTAATPEEVRALFGRRKARIIGKRFRLTHVTMGKELFEVSTFRKTPSEHAGDSSQEKFQKMPENLIVSDNSYGNSREDAFRRDFTVNALFYDPVKDELIDHTGMGLQDIENRTVRAIGDPALRFEEDPVRMLRALKLVAQFDFSLESSTENALFNALPLLEHASAGRLSLELEKILKSSSSDRHFEVFFDYGLLNCFIPFLAENWGTPQCKRAIDLLYERNCRVDAEIYRDSISLALAAMMFPFVTGETGGGTTPQWLERTPENDEMFHRFAVEMFSPLTLMVKVREAAMRIIQMQKMLEEASNDAIAQLMRYKSYAHARELLMIRHLANGEDVSTLEARFPKGNDPRDFHHLASYPRQNQSPNRKKSGRKHYRRRKKRPETPPDFTE